MNATRDKYDEQIDRLCGISDSERRTERTYSEWDNCKGVFQTANRSGDTSGPYGCLTQIRSHSYNGPTEELTREIRADNRIPHGIASLRGVARIGGKEFRDALEACAEWQRRLDREIRNPTPSATSE